MTMTDIEAKALALVNEACKSDFKDLGATYRNNILDALLLAIECLEATEARHAAEMRELKERFEAFRQEVSDAIESCMLGPIAEERLAPFILPKPDPLAEALKEADGPAIGKDGYGAMAERTRAALAARGYEVRKIGEAGE